MSAGGVRPGGREISRMLSAEGLKLGSLPAIRLTLCATLIVNLILAAAFISAGLQGSTGTRSALDIGIASVGYSQAGFMLLGILAACSEYSGGQIRTTLAVMPRRGLQLITAQLALALLALPGAAILSASGLLAAVIFLGDASGPIEWHQAVAVLMGATGCLTLTALMSSAVGVLLRRTLPATAALLGYYFIAGPLLRDKTALAKYLPDTAGLAMWFPQPGGGNGLGPAQGAALMLAWTLGSVLAAVWVYRKRDM